MHNRMINRISGKMSQAIFSLLLLQALLCALCTAQNPPPSMADTFQGMGEVEFHGAESTAFGKCKLGACEDSFLESMDIMF